MFSPCYQPLAPRVFDTSPFLNIEDLSWMPPPANHNGDRTRAAHHIDRVHPKRKSTSLIQSLRRCTRDGCDFRCYELSSYHDHLSEHERGSLSREEELRVRNVVEAREQRNGRPHHSESPLLLTEWNISPLI